MPYARPEVVFVPQSIDFAKAKAKLLRKIVADLNPSLALAQQATAKAMGHEDWHALAEAFALKRTATTREGYLANAALYLDIQHQALLELFGPALSVGDVIRAWRLTGFDVEGVMPAPASMTQVRSKGTVTEMPLSADLILEILATEVMHSEREGFKVFNLRATLRNGEGRRVGNVEATVYKILYPVSTWDFVEFADTLTHWDFERVKDFNWSFPNFADTLFDRGFLCCTGAELADTLRGQGLFQRILETLIEYCKRIGCLLDVVAVEIAPNQYPEGASFYSLPGDEQHQLAQATLKLEKHVHQVLGKLSEPALRYTRQANHPGNAKKVC